MRSEREVSNPNLVALYPLPPLISKCHFTEPAVGTMLVHHLRMLDRHRANYNKQDTVLAQLLYHLNTVHINASASGVGTTLVHHLQMLAQLAPTIVRKTRYATCTLTQLQQSLTAPTCHHY